MFEILSSFNESILQKKLLKGIKSIEKHMIIFVFGKMQWFVYFILCCIESFA